MCIRDRALVALPDNQHALSGFHDSTVKLFNVNDGAVLRTFKHNTDPVTSLALLPDGLRFVSGSLDGIARIAEHGLGPRPPPATSSSDVVVEMPMSDTVVPPVRAPSATAAAAMLVDTTGDGRADSVHVDTSGDGRPDTIVPLGESARSRNASEIEIEVLELRKSLAETKRQRSLTRQALEDVLRAGGGESNTCLLYTSPSPRDATLSRMPSSA